MRLVDEIEAAAKANGSDGLRLVLPDYWDRIKAALLAGEEMAKHLESEYHYATSLFAEKCPLCQHVARFRAATEGTK